MRKNSKDRVDVYANELKVTIYKNIGDEKFSEIKNVDFKLLSLGFVNSSDYSKVTKYYQKIFNRANAFLSGYYQYEIYLKNYIDKEFFDIWFHDCKVVDMIINNNDMTLVIDDGYWPYDKVYYLNFVNILKNNMDKSKLPFDILSLSVYYTNNKFYLYIEEENDEIYEFVSDGIKFDIKKR